jgi:hypothetical protein
MISFDSGCVSRRPYARPPLKSSPRPRLARFQARCPLNGLLNLSSAGNHVITWRARIRLPQPKQRLCLRVRRQIPTLTNTGWPGRHSNGMYAYDPNSSHCIGPVPVRCREWSVRHPAGAHELCGWLRQQPNTLFDRRFSFSSSTEAGPVVRLGPWSRIPHATAQWTLPNQRDCSRVAFTRAPWRNAHAMESLYATLHTASLCLRTGCSLVRLGQQSIFPVRAASRWFCRRCTEP